MEIAGGIELSVILFVMTAWLVIPVGLILLARGWVRREVARQVTTAMDHQLADPESEQR